MAVSSIGTNQAHEERKVNPQNRPHRTFVMCDTLPEGKVSLATITESWHSSAKRQPARRLGSRSSGEDHQRRFDRTEPFRSEEHTSELQSLMRISYAVFCLKQKKTQTRKPTIH